MEKLDYLILVQAPAYMISETEFAIESAFANHLRILREKTKHRFERMVLAAPQLDKTYYLNNKSSLAVIHSEEGIVFLPLYMIRISVIKFWLFNSVPILRILWKQISKSGFIHTGLSSDIWRPVLFFSTVLATLQEKKILWVVDIDFRRSAWMMYKFGNWSLKSYLLCRYIYDGFRKAQILYAIRKCSLVLLKGKKMVEDFGKNKNHVLNFFDTVHSAENILSKIELDDKVERLKKDQPLRFVYFGRLVKYKGIDLSIKAVNAACNNSSRNFEFHIIGIGEKKDDLQMLVKSLNAESQVFFHDPVPYGPTLFDKIKKYDVCLATPISEDTPRAAFDAMALGLPCIAFDTLYYQDLHELSEAVEIVPWPNIELLSNKIIELDKDREKVIEMAIKAINFSLKNTQDIWLDKRLEWSFKIIDGIPIENENPRLNGDYVKSCYSKKN